MELLVTGKFRLSEKIRVTLKVDLLVSKYVSNCVGHYLCLLLEFNKKSYCPHSSVCTREPHIIIGINVLRKTFQYV